MPTAISTTPSKQVLLADGDVIQAETVADILKSQGLDVQTAPSFEAADNALSQKEPPFGAAIVNLTMPNNGGLDVLKAALKYNPDCSVMVLSTFANASEAAEALAIGAYVVVTKPLHPAHFKNALDRLIERASLVSERNFLRGRLAELESKVESLEATKGRMEMLAREISPSNDEQRARSLDELEQVASLRTKGILTEEQFRSAREFLLSRWLS
jgi:DNA-binding NtrC family response regulator